MAIGTRPRIGSPLTSDEISAAIAAGFDPNAVRQSGQEDPIDPGEARGVQSVENIRNVLYNNQGGAGQPAQGSAPAAAPTAAAPTAVGPSAGATNVSSSGANSSSATPSGAGATGSDISASSLMSLFGSQPLAQTQSQQVMAPQAIRPNLGQRIPPSLDSLFSQAAGQVY